MKIEQYYERKDPEDKYGTSPVIYRALQFETRLSVDCVKKLAAKEDPMLAGCIVFIGIVDRETRFRVKIEDAASTAFSRFLYEVMNWEGNSTRWNR